MIYSVSIPNITTPNGLYDITIDICHDISGDDVVIESSLFGIQQLIHTIDYDEDNLASILGDFQLTIIDTIPERTIINLLKNISVDYSNTKINITKDSAPYFTGYIDETNIFYTSKTKILELHFKPRTFLLNDLKIWTDDFCNIDKLGWDTYNVNPVDNDEDNWHGNVVDIIHRIFKIVNPSCTIEVLNHSWLFGSSPDTCNVNLSNIYCRNYFLLGFFGTIPKAWNFGNGWGLDPATPESWMDFAKQLCFDFGLCAGMISEDKVVVFEFGNILNEIKIDELNVISSTIKCEKYLPAKLTLTHNNGSYVWAEIVNPNVKHAIITENIDKTIYGDIYYKKTAPNTYVGLSYCKTFGDTTGVLTRDYFLPEYWANILFNKKRNIVYEKKLHGIIELNVGSVLNIADELYKINSVEYDLTKNVTTLSLHLI